MIWIDKRQFNANFDWYLENRRLDNFGHICTAVGYAVVTLLCEYFTAVWTCPICHVWVQYRFVPTPAQWMLCNSVQYYASLSLHIEVCVPSTYWISRESTYRYTVRTDYAVSKILNLPTTESIYAVRKKIKRNSRREISIYRKVSFYFLRNIMRK